MTLACEDGNSKLVEVVTVANVDDEDHVGNSLLNNNDQYSCEEDVFQVFLCHFHFHDSDENEGLPVALTGQQLLGCHPCLRG